MGGGWLDSWVSVCKVVKATNGTVFILHNAAKRGKFGDGEFAGYFDGQAQGGELKLAQTLECRIQFVPYEAMELERTDAFYKRAGCSSHAALLAMTALGTPEARFEWAKGDEHVLVSFLKIY